MWRPRWVARFLAYSARSASRIRASRLSPPSSDAATPIAGELIPLDPTGTPISDAAWALENLARAKQSLPNGYCGLPLQQTCPHPNACLTCDSFLTTAEFLPQHREQLTRTQQLIAQAEADGRQRLVDMNEPVRLNLIRIIDGLQALGDADAC